MPGDAERGLSGYIETVAAGTPTPGGGSVAAVVGALAAALGEMVVNLTVGRETQAGAERELRPVLDRLTARRGTLLAAAAADARAYASYRAAVDLPRGTDDEMATRTGAVQEALIEATEIPIGVARAAAEIVDMLENVALLGNPHLRSDVALGALLAETALRGGLLNVRGNAALLRDRERAKAYLAEADRLERSGRAAAERACRTATGDAADGVR